MRAYGPRSIEQVRAHERSTREVWRHAFLVRKRKTHGIEGCMEHNFNVVDDERVLGDKLHCDKRRRGGRVV